MDTAILPDCCNIIALGVPCLNHLDSERKAYRTFVEIAALALGQDRAAIETGLNEMLRPLGIPEGSEVWKRAWNHHFGKNVCAAWGLDV